MINENNKLLLEQFGAHIRKLRMAKNLTYRKLATLCNIDYSNLRKIEQGRLNVTLITIHELARGLEIPVSQLFEHQVKA